MEKNESNDSNNNNLPNACIYQPDVQAFRVTRCRGHTLAPGGFGILLSNEPTEKDTQDRDEVVPPQPIVPKEYLLIEEVLVLYERGLLEACNEKNERLESRELYNMLEPLGVQLPVYLVYAHLRQQTYRVVRHTPARRDILEKMEAIVDANNGSISSSYFRKDVAPSRLRLALRRDAAQAPPPRMFATAFDVYQPNSTFSRSCPGRPDFYVAVFSFAHAFPTFATLQSLVEACQGLPLKIATVSDSGTVVVLGITDFGVPAMGKVAPA
jgi:hypothetical protein